MGIMVIVNVLLMMKEIPTHAIINVNYVIPYAAMYIIIKKNKIYIAQIVKIMFVK
jgi:hypothetical protein